MNNKIGIKKLSVALVCVVLNVMVLHAQAYFNVINYGAKNDSSKLATVAINEAIEAAFKVGGGTVYFPPGKYLTGSIHLKSNITILIDAGAVLNFSDNFDDYLPMVETRYEGVDVTSFSPLFYAYKAENITIKGEGIIDGHGKKWWDYVLNFNDKQPHNKWQLLFEANNKNTVLTADSSQMKRGFLRPPFIQPMYCKNVTVQGIKIRNSPFWTVTPEFCENVVVDGVTIDNPRSPNTDGINAESCKYVHISNCHISVGDDCITIKSGKDEPGRTKAAPAENYTITNCTMLNGHGGVVIGSEMSAGVKKIVISNCVFDGTDRGIRIKTSRGRGGVVEEIRVDNIVMKNIKLEAFVLDMQYGKSKLEPISVRTPQFKNIHFSNITAQAKNAVFINGLEEMPIDGITFNDIQFITENGINIKEAKNIEFHNVTITNKNGAALMAQSVDGLELDGFKSLKPINNVPVISIENVQNVFVHNCWPVIGTSTFINAKGKGSKSIILKGNNFINTPNPLLKSDEVTEVIKVD